MNGFSPQFVSAKAWRPRKGFTLVEMLVVLAILAMLAGIGVAVLNNSRRSSGLHAFTHQMEALARQTRNFGIQNQTSSFLRLSDDPDDAGKKKIAGISVRYEGFWRFEDLQSGQTFGALSHNAKVYGGVTQVPGKVGRAFEFSGGSLDCGAPSAFEIREGITLEAWVYPAKFGVRQSILTKMFDYQLTLEPDGQLRFRVENETLLSGATLNPNQWNLVQAVYDGTFIGIKINEKGRNRKPSRVKIQPNPDKSVKVGEGFIGRLDELKLGIYSLDKEYSVPTGLTVTFVPTPVQNQNQNQNQPAALIPFDEKGALDIVKDPRLQQGASIIVTKGALAREITIDPGGRIELKPQ